MADKMRMLSPEQRKEKSVFANEGAKCAIEGELSEQTNERDFYFGPKKMKKLKNSA